MTIDSITSELTEVFRDIFDDEGLEIHNDMTAHDVEEWDSLSHIRLIVAAENKFGVRFTQIEIEQLENVGDFKRLIESKVGK